MFPKYSAVRAPRRGGCRGQQRAMMTASGGSPAATAGMERLVTSAALPC